MQGRERKRFDQGDDRDGKKIAPSYAVAAAPAIYSPTWIRVAYAAGAQSRCISAPGIERVCTVRYEAVNAMLLNEFLKEHCKVEKLTNDFQATVAQQRKEIQALAATVKEQAAQIQKVSAQIEVTKSAPQTVLNDQ